MTVERKHYILGGLKVYSSRMKNDETVFLRMVHYPEATQLGFPSIGGEAVAESLTVLSADEVSLNHFDPTKGNIEGRSVETYYQDQINRADLSSQGCLGSLIGYRSKIYWKP